MESLILSALGFGVMDFVLFFAMFDHTRFGLAYCLLELLWDILFYQSTFISLFRKRLHLTGYLARL